MSLHVCIVAPYIYPVLMGILKKEVAGAFAGGAEFQQTILAAELTRAGVEVSILTETPWPEQQVMVDDIRVIKLPNCSGGVPIVRNIHPRLTRIYSALRQLRCDIYYQRCAGANTLATALLARTRRCPFVYAGAHDLDFDLPNTDKQFSYRGGWREARLFRIGLRMADGVITQHAIQADALQRWHGKVGQVIPNCYPTPASLSPRTGTHVLWVGTIKAVKRPDLFLSLARSLPNLQFKMIGGPGGPDGDNTFRLIRAEADHIPNLEFCGFIPVAEVEQHFDQAKLFINTSDSEGFPNTFLQAWSRGVPSVSFLGQASNTESNGGDISCVDLVDMTSKVREMIESHDAWQAASERCKGHFEQLHSPGTVIPKLVTYLEDLKIRHKK